MRKLAFLIFFFTLCAAKAGSAPIFSSLTPLQGDTVIVAFKNNLNIASGTFDGAPISFLRYQSSSLALFGIAPTKPKGDYPLRITFINDEEFERRITVVPRKFTKTILPIPKQVNLTPKALVASLQIINSKLREIVGETTEALFNKPFGLPLSDNRRIGSPFGEIRKTGEEEIRHLGVDIAAKSGTPVVAMNNGVVKKSYYDAVYGNSVIIDHGAGIFSLYLHLKNRLVKEGDKVKRGGLVGTVGDTGLASAPHLHLSVKIQGISVDPLRFVKAWGKIFKP